VLAGRASEIVGLVEPGERVGHEVEVEVGRDVGNDRPRHEQTSLRRCI